MVFGGYRVKTANGWLWVFTSGYEWLGVVMGGYGLLWVAMGFRRMIEHRCYMSHSQMLGKFEYTLPAKF